MITIREMNQLILPYTMEVKNLSMNSEYREFDFILYKKSEIGSGKSVVTDVAIIEEVITKLMESCDFVSTRYDSETNMIHFIQNAEEHTKEHVNLTEVKVIKDKKLPHVNKVSPREDKPKSLAEKIASAYGPL